MNILRAIRRQRAVNRAYDNGYEQGRLDERIESATGKRPGLVVECPACGIRGHGVRECSLRRTCGCVKGMGRRDPKCHSYGLCGLASRTDRHLEPLMTTTTHTPECTDCGCDETCTAPIQHEHDKTCFATGCPAIREAHQQQVRERFARVAAAVARELDGLGLTPGHFYAESIAGVVIDAIFPPTDGPQPGDVRLA